MHLICTLFIYLCTVALLNATPIDNGVEGDPEIECAGDSITVNFNTRNEFQGHVYVKGRFAEPECRSDEGGRRVAGIKLAFTACGTKRDRSLNPKGVFVSNTVVITFHPQFLTKVDRAYTVSCFYMEADKTVSQELEVSEITTAFQTQTVPMPLCRYDILDGGPTGEPIKFATIGQQVYHKWTCETETVDIFCAVVHSCLVDDGAGNNVQLLNEQGCALDKFLLNNLEYQTDLMAGHEAHVFKYADKPALFFQCQISISIKEPAQECPRPQCPEPQGFGAPGSAATGGSAGSGNAGSVAPPSGTRAPPSGTRAPPSGTRAPVVTPAATTATKAPPPGITPSAPAGTTPPPATTAPPRRTTLAPAPAANASLVARRDFAQFPFRFRYAREVAAVKEQAAAVRRQRAAAMNVETVGTWDVTAQPITTFDLDDDRASLQSSLGRHQTAVDRTRLDNGSSYCISPVSFGVMIAFMAVSVLTGLVVIAFACIRRTTSKL